MDDVQDARRYSRLSSEIGDQQRRRWVFLRGLQHEGVPGGDRVGEHPERDHCREVERSYAGDDPERLANRIDVDSGRGLFGELALQQLRDAARVLDIFDTACDLPERVCVYLAVLRGDE